MESCRIRKPGITERLDFVDAPAHAADLARSPADDPPDSWLRLNRIVGLLSIAPGSAGFR
ncbi:hypothetical protein [Methanosphaerula subterraneus]|uniref:hypothetical protein n=1 Tax=Methanosphaerula subterraneus TaxID=3350244 RepID=UPI003F870B71